MNVEVKEINQKNAKYIIYVKLDNTNISAIIVNNEIERDINVKLLNLLYEGI